MRQTTARPFFALGITVLALGCSPRLEPIKFTSPPPAPRPASRPSARELTCERLRAQWADLTPERPVQHLTLTKVRQQTIRKGCNGETESDQLEVISSPTETVALNTRDPLPIEAKAADILTAETCNMFGQTRLPVTQLATLGLSPITGDTRGRMNIRFDASPATFTVHLNEGLNRVFLTFYANCLADRAGRLQVAANGCPDPGEISTKLFLINMIYGERTEPGTRTIEKSRETCQREAARAEERARAQPQPNPPR